MKFILRFTPDTSEAIGKHADSNAKFHYFVNHGQDWPHRKGFRLIGETTQNRDNARRFDTHEEAMAALKLSDDPPGWQIDEVAL